MKKRPRSYLVLAALCLPLVLYSATNYTLGVLFERGVEGRLKRAADAGTVDFAAKELRAALAYLEEHELTEGYTSILWTLPEEDIGFWHGNLRDSLAELEGITPEAGKLERTNVLMKLRETILDQKAEGGVVVTVPPGITRYPHNRLFAAWLALASTGAAVGAGLFILDSKRR